jgi:two-component system sensor histidine kinase HydH
MRSSTLSKGSSHKARWGLLIVTIAMGAALVATGVTGYLGARRASDTFGRAAASAMLFAVKRDVWRSADSPQEAVELAVEEMGEQGLVFAAVFDKKGQQLHAAGTPLADFSRIPRRRVLGKIRVVPLGRPGTVRAMAPVVASKRRGRDRGDQAGRGRGRRQFLVIDTEPRIVGMIMSRAVITLMITLGASVILVIAAVVFFRLSRRADAIEAQLARDQRLKALGQMSAVLGHELRNPLASLKGHAQLLLEKLEPDHRGRGGAETVVREAARLEQLTTQVLDFARTGQLERERVDIAALSRSAIERAEADPVELVGGEAPIYCAVDPGRLEQVLVNLLHNARQASIPDAVVELDLGRERQLLVIAVRDQGAGIEPGDEERIFEPFVTTRVRGTGLGLALARRIIEDHGGRLSATNHPDGGAVFRVELPDRDEES